MAVLSQSKAFLRDVCHTVADAFTFGPVPSADLCGYRQSSSAASSSSAPEEGESNLLQEFATQTHTTQTTTETHMQTVESPEHHVSNNQMNSDHRLSSSFPPLDRHLHTHTG